MGIDTGCVTAKCTYLTRRAGSADTVFVPESTRSTVQLTRLVPNEALGVPEPHEARETRTVTVTDPASKK